MQSHWKKPARAIPSTMTIMPAMKMIVDQLMPDEDSASPAEYQKPGVKILPTFSVSRMALPLRIARPNTRIRVSSPHPSVTICRSILSRTIRTNITTKRMTANICAINTFFNLPTCYNK